MRKTSLVNRFILGLLILCFCSAIGLLQFIQLDQVTTATANAESSQEANKLYPTPTIVTPPDSYKYYLPIIIQPATIPVGAQLINSENNGIIPPGSIVLTSIKWSQVESQPGIYIWPHIWLDDYKIILQVKSAPEWARGANSLPCSPPTSEYLDEFIAFTVAMVHNYYGVFGDKLLGVSIWNEPDAFDDDAIVTIESNPRPWSDLYGCIPDPAYYAQMVRGVYEALQQDTNPIPVIAGEFLFDDDTPDTLQITNAYIDQFLQTVDNHFDILSFHRYEWNVTTQGITSRITYLRQLTNKPLALTETSLLCDESLGQTCDLDFELQQRDYLSQITQITDLEWLLWYTGENNGWRNSDMTRPDGTIKPDLWCLYISLAGWTGPTPSICK